MPTVEILENCKDRTAIVVHPDEHVFDPERLTVTLAFRTASRTASRFWFCRPFSDRL